MSQLPPLNALRAFDAAGRHLNFRRAADEMSVTQAAVAQQVRLLETHLGMTLFERQPKGLAFTSAGRSYHARIATAFDELRAATRTLRPEPGKVMLSVTPTFAAKWLVPNLPDLHAAHPDIDLRILATETLSSFHSEGVDLAIRQGQPPFGASLHAVRLFRQDIIAVAAPQLLANEPLPLSPETLVRLPKLHDGHDLWPDFLKLLGLKDQAGRGLRLNQTGLAIDAALTGQGIALVSKFLVTRDLAAKTLVQVTPTVLTGKQDFYLLSGRRQKTGAAATSVHQWLLSKSEP